MTIDELMKRLQAAFPWRSAADLELAAEDYRAALGRHAGPKLAEAWAATIATWTDRRHRPLPGDIGANIARPLAGIGGSGGGGGEAIGNILDEAKRRHRGLIEAWWRDNGGEWLDEQIAVHGFDGSDARFFRWHLHYVVSDAAWRVAQLQARGRSACVTIDAAELDGIAERVRSQRPHGHRPPSERGSGQPAWVKRDMAERLASVGLEATS